MVDQEVLKSVQALLEGQIVAFPTDTVFGVLVRIEDQAACESVYKLKHRSMRKPLQVLVADLQAALALCMPGPEQSALKQLAGVFWPGPLTLVVPARGIPVWISGDGTVGLRVPDHTELRALLKAVGGHLAASSLNISGLPPLETAEEAQRRFPLIQRFHPGKPPTHTPSTVYDLVHRLALRTGEIKATDIEARL